MTETMIDLRALLVEREEFEGSMVSKLREGLAQGGQQIKTLRDINETLNKRLAAAAGPAAKKLHLKLGVVQFFLGHLTPAIDHLKQSDGPLAAFFLGRAYAQRGEYDDALKAFEKAEKSGYAAQQVQLQRAGVLRLQNHLPEAKAILSKIKDMAAHNAEFHYQEGGVAFEVVLASHHRLGAIARGQLHRPAVVGPVAQARSRPGQAQVGRVVVGGDQLDLVVIEDAQAAEIVEPRQLEGLGDLELVFALLVAPGRLGAHRSPLLDH